MLHFVVEAFRTVVQCRKKICLRVFDQVRNKPACAAGEASKNLAIFAIETSDFAAKTMTLTSLGGSISDLRL